MMKVLLRRLQGSLRGSITAIDRALAAHIGCDHKTVGRIREEMEATAQIAQSTTRRGRDGGSNRLAKFASRRIAGSPRGRRALR
jgi:hypothetical protein